MKPILGFKAARLAQMMLPYLQTVKYIGLSYRAGASSVINGVLDRMNNSCECRFCGGSLVEFVDLTMSPLCENYLAKNQLQFDGAVIRSPPRPAAIASSCSNSFVEGIRIILGPNGVCTMEVPHLLRTIASNQFDQIHHEHFSCFSALAAIAETRPDYALILPYYLKDEVIAQFGYIRDWGAKLVVPIPEVSFY